MYENCRATPVFFDWHYYIEINKLPHTWNWANAFLHYRAVGMKRGLKTAAKDKQDLLAAQTNFDWQYYVQAHKLKKIKTKEKAYAHYMRIGKYKKLRYCQSYKILITLHLYNLMLVDDILAKVAYFIENNREHDFIIYINIPVDTNIYDVGESITQTNIGDIDHARRLCTYVSRPLDRDVQIQLNKVYTYISDKMNKVGVTAKVVFSDNIGQDIGGFFFLLDQIKHDHVNFDYVVKIHSKSDDYWRNMLLSMLDCKISPIVRDYDCFYTVPIAYRDITFTTDALRRCLEKRFKEVLSIFSLPFDDDFKYSSGTMFIASSRLVDFLNQFDVLSIIHYLNPGKPAFPTIEHGFELFFGYLAKYLGLRTI
jgi:hypothetical protein